MRKGWFSIDGVQTGDRTLEQQMTGLQEALQACRGKRVLDLGAAEGLIAREFARAGALEVVGIECNEESATVAEKQCRGLPVQIVTANLNNYRLRGRFDIVLALAILHKLKDPAGTVDAIAARAPGLVVVRLPAGSEGYFVTKIHGTPINVNTHFRKRGFDLQQTLVGPLKEQVQYWRPLKS